VVTRILALPESEVSALADAVVAEFEDRHPDLAGILARHFAVVAHEVPADETLNAHRRTLIGASFTHEHAPRRRHSSIRRWRRIPTRPVWTLARPGSP
jgi:hypothetical protein